MSANIATESIKKQIFYGFFLFTPRKLIFLKNFKVSGRNQLRIILCPSFYKKLEMPFIDVVLFLLADNQLMPVRA